MEGNKSERTIVGVNVESPAHLLGRTAVTEYLRRKLKQNNFFARISGG